jgi:hypothetical protein
MLDEYFFGDQDGQNMFDNVSMVVHPEFGDGSHDYIYVYRNRRIEVVRHQISLDPLVVGKSELVFETDLEFEEHSGGDLAWWDGETGEDTLYVSLGMDAAPTTPGANLSCQDGSSTACSIIALKENSDGTLVAGVPDTPFSNPLVVAKGLRQPWRMADCGEGLCVVDVADDTIIEELNLYTQSGDNFGFPYQDGNEKEDDGYKTALLQYLDTDPYFADSDPDNSGAMRQMKVPWISEALFTDNVFAPELTGKLIWADIYDGWLRTFDPLDKPTPTTEHLAHLRYIGSMVEAPDGQVYAVSMIGTLNQLVYRNEVLRIGESGMALQDTSYFDDGIEYQVMHPFWSNGAEKSRKLQLPKGELIDNTMATWQYPIGTRLWKTFGWKGQAVEVRLLEYRETGWVAGTFIYEADGQAYLSDGYNKTVTTTDGEYAVPSEVACYECHGGTAGKIVPLSLEEFQLGDAGLDLLRPHLIQDPGVAPQVVEGDALEQSIRGALHANCSFCHNPLGRPTSLAYVKMNLLFDVPLAETQTIDKAIRIFQPTPGVAPSALSIIKPGSSHDSALPKAIMEGYMPPLGIWNPDEALANDIVDWIDAWED